MGIQKATVTVKGVSPLLMHRYPLVPIEALEKKSPAEQAEVAAYRDPETRELYVPGVNLQRGLVSAATFSKGKGRASLQKAAAACVMVSPQYLNLGTREYALDSQAVVIPATKGRVVRHRPRLDTWTISFVIEWDDTLLEEKQLRRSLDDMGSRVGLLDFRPEKKGPFGRFMVTEWELD